MRTSLCGLLVLAGCNWVFELSSTRLPPPLDGPVDAPPCGTIGGPCCEGTCSDGTQCLTSAGRGRCMAFAGVYEDDPNHTCTVSCVSANPFTGACSCPAGFGVPETAKLDTGCGDPVTPTNTDGLGLFCSISTIPDGSDWGGAFLTSDLPDCEPTTIPPDCLMVNPMTQDCTCPSGITPIQLRVFVPGVFNGISCVNPDLGGTLSVCLLSVPVPMIRGIFERDALGVCRQTAAGLTDCTCPPDSIASTLRTVEESAPAGTFPETSITFCLAAP